MQAIPWVAKGLAAIGGGSAAAGAATVAGTAATAYSATQMAKAPKMQVPGQAPGVPRIDQAAKNLQQMDRIRKRTGVLATIFGGREANSGPNVASKTLLGS